MLSCLENMCNKKSEKSETWIATVVTSVVYLFKFCRLTIFSSSEDGLTLAGYCPIAAAFTGVTESG